MPGHSDLWTARKGMARMMAARHASGGLVLYSPIADPHDAALDAANDLGGVRAIIAPSPFHHLGVASWLDAFSDAELHAPAPAIDRLEKRIGATLSGEPPNLSDSVDILVPDGLKASEYWLRARGGDGVTWAVCDAFAGPAGTDDAPAEIPKARGSFAKMCVGDVAAYTAWAVAQLEQDHPTRLLPAHGNAVVTRDLPQHLLTLLEGL